MIGPSHPVFIIAEAGVNHNGDIELAKKLVVEAKRVGADCVKFQTFRADDLVTLSAPKAAYQLKVTDPGESQFAMLKKLELPFDDYVELLALCRELGIMFLSTPYNFADVDFLHKLDAPAYKLASMHLTESPMIEYVGKKGKPVFLATGMGHISDVVAAADAFAQTGNNNLVLMQSTTDYPAKPEDAHLRSIRAIEDATGAIVGYSDNSGITDTCIMAVAAGAYVIEKHFTLDKQLSGPDHSASANPEEFAAMVQRIREVERALGSAEKHITPLEARNMVGMKRSLTAVVPIPAGMIITADVLGFKRPATGLHPNRYYDVIGKKARRDIAQDQTLTEEDIV